MENSSRDSNSRRPRSLLWLAGLLLLAQSFGFGGPIRAQGPENDRAAATEILGLINEWRLEQGLWPLRPNSTLEAMAVAQARFIFARADSLTDPADFHRDAAGLFPAQRAVRPPYNWPSYGSDTARTEIGENAGVGSPRFVMNFWKGSATHTRATLSDVYREVGVAALPRPDRTFVYMIVFGARPGVLTAQVGPQGNTLLLSNDRSRYAPVAPENQRIRLFDSNGVSLTPNGPWSSVVPLPSGQSSPVFVLFTNGETQSLVAVDIVRDVAILPANAAIVAQRPTSTASATPLPTGTPTATATSQSQPTRAAGTPSASATATASAATTAPGPTRPGLALIYNANTLFVLNATTGAVNLSNLSIGNETSRSTMERWLLVASFPANAFPAGHCLSVTTLGTTPSPPSACRFLRSELNVSASRAYWTQGEFTVRLGDTEIGRCSADAGRCDVPLP
jgi:uncharacterized protein YkwD